MNHASHSLRRQWLGVRVGALLTLALLMLLPRTNNAAESLGTAVQAVIQTEAQLAAAVIAAGTDEQRRALVTAHPQLINIPFRHTLAMQVLRWQMKGEHERVLAVLAFARKLAEERQDKGWIAMTWIDSAGSLDLIGRRNEAMAAALKSQNVKEFEPDRMALAHIEGVQAFVALLSGRPEFRPIARQKAAHSLTLFTPEQKLESGLAYCVLGMLEVGNVESENAPQYLQQSIQLFAELGDRFWSAIPLNYLGEHYRIRGDALSAIQYLRRSVEISEEFGIHFLLYYTTNQLGHAYRQLGDSTNALRAYEKSLREREQLGDKRKICVMFSSLADLYSDEGNYEKALEYAQRALQLSLATEYHSMTADIYGTLANIYFLQGNREMEMEAREKNLEAARKSGDKADLVRSLYSLAMGYEHRDEFAKSLQTLQQALQINETLPLNRTRLSIYESIGWIYFRQHDLNKALSYFNQALNLLEKVYYPTHHYALLNSIGAVHFARTEYQEALSNYQRSFALAQKYHVEEAYLSGLSANIGRTQHALKQYEPALASFEQGLTFAESWQRRVIDPDSRSLFLARHHKFFEQYIELLMDLHTQHPTAGYAGKAMEINERASARSLLDLLAEAQTNLKQGVGESLLEHERDLQRQINGKSAQLALPGNKTQTTNLTQEISLLTIELKKVEAQIRIASPRYAALARPQPLTTTQVQQQVLDADTLLLEYQLGEQQCWLWAVTPDEVTSYLLPPRAEIEAVAIRVRQMLLAPPTKATAADYWVAAEKLSRLILGPVANKLGHKRLVIVADGILQYLPFAALPEPSVVSRLLSVTKKTASNNRQQVTENGTPLIVKHEVVSLPSASTLAVLRSEQMGRKSAPKTVAVLADPVFSADDLRVKTSRVATTTATTPTQNEPVAGAESSPLGRTLRDFRGPLSRLYFSREEAEAIYAAAPTDAGYKALDFQANRGLVTSVQSGFS